MIYGSIHYLRGILGLFGPSDRQCLCFDPKRGPAPPTLPERDSLILPPNSKYSQYSYLIVYGGYNTRGRVGADIFGERGFYLVKQGLGFWLDGA